MDHVQKTIELALAKLREQEAQVAETKKLINSLRKLSGQDPLFPNSDATPEGTLAGFRSDQFYGQPLSTVVRQILEARQVANLGPASVNEIYEAMIAGGYKFETANPENARRGLRISLTKNAATFHKLPNGNYGLRKWYPGLKEGKPKAGANGGTSPEAEAVETEEDSFDFAEKERAADESA